MQVKARHIVGLFVIAVVTAAFREELTAQMKKLGWAYDWLRFEIGHLSRARLGEDVTDGEREAAEFAHTIAADLVKRAREVEARCYPR